MTRYRLDTNVLIRFLTHDDPQQAEDTHTLFRDAEDGRCVLVLDTIVLVEAVWVLSSVYNLPRKKIAESLARLVVMPGIRCKKSRVTLDALARYRQSKLDVVDCFLAAQAVAEGDFVATFDRGFRGWPDVRLWNRGTAA